MPPIVGPLTLLDLAAVAGIAVVLPLALGGAVRWTAASLGLLVACWLETGSTVAVVLVVPALGVAVTSALVRVRALGWPSHLAAAGTHLAHAYAVVAVTWLGLHAAGWEPVGIHEPIVQLTSIHFAYAGVGALVLAVSAWHDAEGGRLATVAVVLSGAAPPVVALGFTTRWAAAQVGGAVLMTIGVWCTALCLLRRARQRTIAARSRALLAVSGLAVWVPMVLAVAWAAAQHWSVPALSVPDMARTHGMVNGLGFVIAGLVATARDRSEGWS